MLFCAPPVIAVYGSGSSSSHDYGSAGTYVPESEHDESRECLATKLSASWLFPSAQRVNRNSLVVCFVFPTKPKFFLAARFRAHTWRRGFGEPFPFPFPEVAALRKPLHQINAAGRTRRLASALSHSSTNWNKAFLLGQCRRTPMSDDGCLCSYDPLLACTHSASSVSR
jgi:hypothetical protein